MFSRINGHKIIPQSQERLQCKNAFQWPLTYEAVSVKKTAVRALSLFNLLLNRHNVRPPDAK